MAKFFPKFEVRKLAFGAVALVALWVVFQLHWRRPAVLVNELCDRLEDIDSTLVNSPSLDEDDKGTVKEMKQICDVRQPVD